MDAHALALAYSLSTIAGLRASFILLAVSAAIHLHLVHPPAVAAWMGSDATLAVTGICTLADFFGDKIPLVDHGLHLVHAVLTPVSGGIAAATVGAGDAQSAALLGIAGAANAAGLHGLRSTTRLAATATSFGVLTPFISAGEDAAAIISTIVAFFAPVFFAVIGIIVTCAALILGIKLRRSRKKAR